MPSLLDNPSIPIIGQPSVKVLGYTILALTQCSCSAGDPMQVILHCEAGQTQAIPSTCPRCKSRYSVHAIGATEHGGLALAFKHESPQAV